MSVAELSVRCTIAPFVQTLQGRIANLLGYWAAKKVKISLLQAVEVHRVARG
jgi:hypothetical protein